MSPKSLTMELDMSEVLRNMGVLTNHVMPSKIRAGLRLAGIELMKDAITVVNTVPIKRPGYSSPDRVPGELRASGAVFVDGKKVKTAISYGEGATGKYQPETYGGTRIPKNSHEACIVFNAPYAAEQHEEWPTKTEPTAGTNYLGGKLTENAMKYTKIVANGMRL